jgi:hypothetical protein
VLFSDSIKVSGNDTIFHLNRIGVFCNGSCPTITGTVPAGAIAVNMPQFLQRQIIKHNSGLYSLYDTAHFVIKSLAQNGQSWIFDTTSAVTATCIAKIASNTFNFPDSVKTIILSSGDTIRLSKHFGVLQFPTPYSKNTYYRLAGIENSASYDSTALYGLKVPNAWDIYKFSSGDRFCSTVSIIYTKGQGSVTQYQKILDIDSLRIVNGGYTYYDAGSPILVFNSQFLSGINTLENKMYPGQIISSGYYPQVGLSVPGIVYVYNIVRFETDAQQRFYKAAGPACPNSVSLTNTIQIQPGYEYTGSYLNANSIAGPGLLSDIYGVGLGAVHRKLWRTGEQFDLCLNCAKKSGTGTFGSAILLGVKDQLQNDPVIYPNPTTGKIMLKAPGSQKWNLNLVDMSGKNIPIVVTKDTENAKEFEIEVAGGIYFLRIIEDGKNIKTEKIIVLSSADH